MRLRSRLQKLERAAPAPIKPDLSRSDPNSPCYEPWCDERFGETALAVMAGQLAPGEFPAGMPEKLRPLEIAFVVDLLMAAQMAGHPTSLADRRSLAWLAAINVDLGLSK